MLTAEISKDGKTLTITCPLGEPKVSKGGEGKNMLIFSETAKEALTLKGKAVTIGINAYYKI